MRRLFSKNPMPHKIIDKAVFCVDKSAALCYIMRINGYEEKQ